MNGGFAAQQTQKTGFIHWREKRLIGLLNQRLLKGERGAKLREGGKEEV